MSNNLNTLVFDVNETLLDLEPLKSSINTALGDENAADLWFAQLLQYSLVETVTGSYHDFSQIAGVVLNMAAKKYHKEFSDKEIEKILDPIKKLEPYPDVEPGLMKLKNAGFQLIAFSNGKPSVLNEQLEFAGLTSYFDKILSVDAIKKYKPHPASYEYALKETSSKAEHTMMVAAHGWDIAGAIRAGLKTAFIERPGKTLYPLLEKPEITAKDCKKLSELLTMSR